MSHLQYSRYPGFGENVYERMHYSIAVRLPPGEQVTISGQGGWDPETSKIREGLEEEFNQAFDNVELALKHAGTDMAHVYKLVIYYVPISPEAMKLTVEQYRKRFPNHRPLWTAIGVDKLGLPEMHIEIEAWAHLG